MCLIYYGIPSDLIVYIITNDNLGGQQDMLQLGINGHPVDGHINNSEVNNNFHIYINNEKMSIQ